MRKTCNGVRVHKERKERRRESSPSEIERRVRVYNEKKSDGVRINHA